MRQTVKIRLLRLLAVLVIVAIMAPSLTACSQPIDNGSTVPAQSQPFVALLALIGLGIGLTAWHHHNENHGGGGPPPVSVTAPQSVQSLGIGAFDMTLDLSAGGTGGAGAIGNQGAGGTYTFLETDSIGSDNGSYTLPLGYHPRAVAIDAAANDWFVDGVGNVDKCAAPASSVTACTPLLTFSDGLPTAGNRSIAADNTHVFIAEDNNAGTVSWAAFGLDGTGRIAGSYVYTGGLGMATQDAVSTTTGSAAISQFTIVHRDGSSWVITLGTSTTKNSFTLTPAPNSNANVATFDGVNFYGLLGSPTTGSYQIGQWVGTGNTKGLTPGMLVNPPLTIASNGQVNTDAGVYSLPLNSVRSLDGSLVYTLDANGRLVIFPAPSTP